MSGGRFSVPIVFRGPNGAAAQVSCQHSHCVEAIYGNLPGFIIMAPSNPYDAKGMLKSAIRCNDPVIFLENELDYGMKMKIPTKEYLVPIGKAQVIREGKDITIVSHSRMLSHSRAAADEMAKKGIQVELIDIRTIKPLDLPTIAAFTGISAEVGFQIQEHCFDYLDAPIHRVCQRETPLPYAKNMEHASQPNKERILDAISQTLHLRS